MSRKYCFVCHECIGPVPEGLYKDRELCKSCKSLTKAGVMIIGYIESKTIDHSNPYRSGSCLVVTDESIETMIRSIRRYQDSTPFQNALKNRLMFLDELGFEALGLNRAALDQGFEDPKVEA